MNIDQMMSNEELAATGVAGLTESEQKRSLHWGLKVYGLGRHHFAEIVDMKYGDCPVRLGDGSKGKDGSLRGLT